MSYLTKQATIDGGENRAFMANVENVTAGGYCPAAERAFCPDRIPTAKQTRDNQSDELTAEESEALAASMDAADEAVAVIVDNPTGDSDLDAQLRAYRQRQPAWLRRSENRIKKANKKGGQGMKA